MNNFNANKFAIILISLSIFFVTKIYSQEVLFPDSLISGKTYKFVLYNDTEIIGKVLYADSVKIKVQTGNNDIYVIVRDNLLYYSTTAASSKYLFSISLMGGASLYTGNDHYYNHGNGMQTGINIDLAGIYYLSDTKGIKFDLGYSFLKANYEENAIPAIYPYYPYIYEGGDVSNYLFKGNFLLGSFKPASRFIGYGSLGLGFHLSSQNEISEQYYSYEDSVYRTRVYPAESEINAVISFGGGIGYRFSKHLGVHAEIEYNFVTSHDSYFFYYNGRSYFPMRIGVIYTFY